MFIAYHDDPKIKADILAQLQAHYDADELVKGQYWQGGKGCAVGCTIHSGNHMEYEPKFGIPVMLARFEDAIFEGLETADAKEWPLRFMRAVEPGQKLACVGWAFQHWLLTDESVNPGINHPSVKEAMRQCADLLAALKDGGSVDPSAVKSARSAAESAVKSARSAVESAARSAAESAWCAVRSAECAARGAVESASWSARSAADAARSAWCAARSAAECAAECALWSARSASWSAERAESAAWKKMSDRLIELIKVAPSV